MYIPIHICTVQLVQLVTLEKPYMVIIIMTIPKTGVKNKLGKPTLFQSSLRSNLAVLQTRHINREIHQVINRIGLHVKTRNVTDVNV